MSPTDTARATKPSGVFIQLALSLIPFSHIRPFFNFPNFHMILAFDIGGTKHTVALISDDGSVAAEETSATDREAGAAPIVESLLRTAHRLLEEASDVTACGIGFGGPVDFANQRILNSTHVAGWERVDLVDVVRMELGLQAVVENDANAGALGEFAYGAGASAETLIYYTVSTGIGGGIVLDGELYRGTSGNAGEVGHVPILPEDGPLCDCGNRGCLEALCSGPSIARRGNEQMPEKGGKLSAKDVFDLARDEDPAALAVVDETTTYLGMGVAAVMNTLAPDVIVIGGGVAKAGDVLFEPLREKVKAFSMPVHRPFVNILPAKLGDRSVLMGAAVLANRSL